MASVQAKKIAKGEVNAYKDLYNKNRDRVFYICNLLLCSEGSANDSLKAVFKAAFSEISVNSELADSFSQVIEKKAVNYCKIKIAKNNNKEFRIPTSKNFIGIDCTEGNVDTEGKTELVFLKNMPALHRFIYVTSEYLKWSDAEIAELFHTTNEVIALAHEADEANIAKIGRCFSSVTGKDVALTKNELSALIACADVALELDKDTDNAIFLAIDDIVAPIKTKKAKKTKKALTVGVIASLAVLVVVCIVCAVILFGGKEFTSTTSGNGNGQSTQKPSQTEQQAMTGEGVSCNDEDAVTHYATIDIENYGKIKLELYGKVAPETVNNFENLANKGFYNGLTFHRIMEGFMMQGGCPKGDGTGGNTDSNGKEINIRGEYEVNGHYNDISHVRGVISMARNGYDYDSASSQFFIVHEDSEFLDMKYAAFGRVIEGIEVVDAVCEDAEPIDDNGTIPASAQPKIKSVTVEAVK